MGSWKGLAFVVALTTVGWAGDAYADVTHVVQRGHTIEAIAHRYHVSEKAILEANHLKDARHLRVGQTLVIPGVDRRPEGTGRNENVDRRPEGTGRNENVDRRPEGTGRREAVDGPGGELAQRDKKRHVGAGEEDHDANRGEAAGHDGATHKADERGGLPAHGATASVLEEEVDARGSRRRHEGDDEGVTVHAIRLGEEFRIRVRDARGHIPGAALNAFERLMRQGNATQPPDPRLVALVGIVSNHFGGKTIEVVSGYRAYTPTQYTPHSNHNYGKALDFRVRGVRNEALRDFCRTLRSAGCGYYPNSTFVHLDVRPVKAYWVDESRPGEPPKYDKAGSDADEGTSDVPDESGQTPPEKDDSAPQEAPK